MSTQSLPVYNTQFFRVQIQGQEQVRFWPTDTAVSLSYSRLAVTIPGNLLFPQGWVERDAYFQNNPGQLVDGLVCMVGTVGAWTQMQLQQWAAATSTWSDVTASYA